MDFLRGLSYPIAVKDDPPTNAQRRAEAIKLHEIEGNPLTSDDIALLDWLDDQGITGDERRAHIINKIIKRVISQQTDK